MNPLFSIDALLSQPMAISESHWLRLCDRIAPIISDSTLLGAGPNPIESPSAQLLQLLNEEPEPEKPYTVTDGTATISFAGVVSKRTDRWMARWLGLLDLDHYDAAMIAARDDGEVERIKVDFHSPGGSVIGVEDSMMLTRQVSRVKPVLATSDTLLASAAYFIASQATEIRVSNSMIIGSIGVIKGRYDFSEHASEQGIKAHVVRSGDLKAPGHLRGEKITEAQLSYDKEEVMRLFAIHDDHVKASRPALSDDYKRGQLVTGREAVEIGMADSIMALG
ncbi:MAG: S49 family peptidase [Verrucomicrobiota bacterium]